MTLLRRLRATSTRGYTWGFVDQICSSATNFSLSLIAGRALGPDGLGVVVIGFSAYLLALGFQSSLLTTPLVASAAALPEEHRRGEIRRGLAISILAALLATLVFVSCGLAIPGHTGRAFLILSPWLVAGMLQDFLRSMLYQEGRFRRAAANDATWLAVMLLASPLAWFIGGEWAVVASWGCGAAAAAALGFAQLRIRPAPTRHVLGWWRVRIWPFGRWLGLEGTVYSATTTTNVFVLNGVLGAGSVGGLRVAQSVFAPLSLILPAITLPGLPATVRELAVSVRRAMRLAVMLSALVTSLALLYVAVMVLVGRRAIPYLYGSSFRQYEHLALPIGMWQLAGAAGTGFMIFLTAQRRGRELVAIRVTAAVLSTAFIALLASTYGLTGAAWGYAIGSGCATALTFVLVRRSYLRELVARGDRAASAAGVADA
jgi:O-antigen/teichoic acid export membrane protein